MRLRLASSAEAMSFTEHLEELRIRIFKMLLATIIGFVLSYVFIEAIVGFVTAPAGKLYYMRPAEAFFIYMKIGAFAGCLFASPIIFYQIWAFLMPAFSSRQCLWIVGCTVISLSLFLVGLLFSYYIVFPLGLAFFTGFDAHGVEAMISMENYVDFFIMLLLPFGFIFELPLILILLSLTGLITSAGLKILRPYVLLGSFFIAALLTPPDVISQALLALPMLLMYETSIIFIQYILQK